MHDQEGYELDRRPRQLAIKQSNPQNSREDRRSFRNVRTNYVRRPRIMIAGAVMPHLGQRLAGKVRSAMNQTAGLLRDRTTRLSEKNSPDRPRSPRRQRTLNVDPP